MPNETYFLILEHRDTKPGVPYEEMEFTLLQDAWDAFRKFAEPASSEIYSEIEIVRYNWTDNTAHSLARMAFESNGGADK